MAAADDCKSTFHDLLCYFKIRGIDSQVILLRALLYFSASVWCPALCPSHTALKERLRSATGRGTGAALGKGLPKPLGGISRCSVSAVFPVHKLPREMWPVRGGRVLFITLVIKRVRAHLKNPVTTSLCHFLHLCIS